MAKDKHHTYQFNIYNQEDEIEMWDKFLETAQRLKMSKRTAMIAAIELYIETYKDISR